MNDTRKRRPTLQDIADLTGVTKMTVSRYLRDPSAVAEGTRERIAAAVEELGYIPNRAPDMLSNATSKAIGILIPSLSNQVFSAVIHGIEAVTRPRNHERNSSVASTTPPPTKYAVGSVKFDAMRNSVSGVTGRLFSMVWTPMPFT